MKEAIGTVENGLVKLPATVRLPDGLRVRVAWEDEETTVPRSRPSLGRQLCALREQAQNKGMKLLDWEELDHEIEEGKGRREWD